MNTLKYLQRFFILLFVGFALCTVQACGDDEENEPIQEPNEEEVVKPDDGKEEDEPSDKPTSETINGHEYVDLGLSVKWATCNVGASKPEEYGDYFAWGETEEKSDYSWETYKWCKGTYDTMTKYCMINMYGTVDNCTTLTSSDDVATVKWGSKWRIPTEEEIRELNEDCAWGWTTQNGVKGMKVKGPNGNSLFLPAAGYRYGTDFYDRGSSGIYWSATLNEYGNGNACSLFYLLSDDKTLRYNGRCLGYTVRPVTE